MKLGAIVPAAVAGSLALAAASGTAWAQESDLVFYGVQVEQLEYRLGDDEENLAVYDADAFVGTDELKLRWMGEGEYDLDADAFETLENRVVLQTPISDFFDLKGGVRLDTPEGADRWYGVVGVAGLAPQWFEIDADLFLSETGDASARLDVEYELLITNRVVLIPSAEVDVAFSDDEEIGVGAGLSTVEVGLRLSYDLFDRAVSPYVGVAYEAALGETADLRREEGDGTGAIFGVAGVRLLF
jgi:copper resistance protein B